jgi:hypothetical protein
MKEPMSMATKVIMVQEVGTPDEIKSCVNAKGQWYEPHCDRVLLSHGFLPTELVGYQYDEADWSDDLHSSQSVV